MPHSEPVARRLFELTEPISLVNFFSQEPHDAMAALGFRNYWDGYFAGRSAPLGRVPAEVVHAAFYNFAEGEMAVGSACLCGGPMSPCAGCGQLRCLACDPYLSDDCRWGL